MKKQALLPSPGAVLRLVRGRALTLWRSPDSTSASTVAGPCDLLVVAARLDRREHDVLVLVIDPSGRPGWFLSNPDVVSSRVLWDRGEKEGGAP